MDTIFVCFCLTPTLARSPPLRLSLSPSLPLSLSHPPPAPSTTGKTPAAVTQDPELRAKGGKVTVEDFLGLCKGFGIFVDSSSPEKVESYLLKHVVQYLANVDEGAFAVSISPLFLQRSGARNS